MWLNPHMSGKNKVALPPPKKSQGLSLGKSIIWKKIILQRYFVAFARFEGGGRRGRQCELYLPTTSSFPLPAWLSPQAEWGKEWKEKRKGSWPGNHFLALDFVGHLVHTNAKMSSFFPRSVTRGNTHCQSETNAPSSNDQQQRCARQTVDWCKWRKPTSPQRCVTRKRTMDSIRKKEKKKTVCG